jgi:hypothetical protein
MMANVRTGRTADLWERRGAMNRRTRREYLTNSLVPLDSVISFHYKPLSASLPRAGVERRVPR